MVNTNQFIFKIFMEMKEAATSWITSALAYSLLLALIPSLSLLLFFFNTFHVPNTILINFFTKLFPTNLAEIFIGFISETGGGGTAFLLPALAFSIYIVSNTIYLMIRVFNEKIDTKKKNALLLHIKSYLVTLLLIVGSSALLMTLFAVPQLLNLFLIEYLSFPLIWGGTFLFITIIYAIITGKTIRIKDVVSGAFIASLLISVLLGFFGIYSKYFANHQNTYGPFAWMIVLLLLLRLIAYLFYLGMMINVILVKEKRRSIEMIHPS